MRKKPEQERVKRILIIRLGAIGDVVLSSVAVRNIQNDFPEAEIDFCTKHRYVPLIRHNPNIQKIISVSDDTGNAEIIRKIRKHAYDMVVDLQGNIKSRLFSFFSGSRFRTRSSMMRFRRFMLVQFRINLYRNIIPVPIRFLNAVRKWGVSDDGKGPDLFINSKLEERFATRIEKDAGPNTQGFIVLAPGAGRATKRWPADKYSELAKYFLNRGYVIALVGGEEDRSVGREIQDLLKNPVADYIGQLSLQETAIVLKKADLVVTNDTGVMHMAAALDRKIVSLFGPTTVHLGFFPFRASAVVIEKDIPCRPCSFHGTDQCPRRHFNCMLSIDSREVVREADRLLSEGSK